MREDRAGLLSIPCSVLFQLDNLRGIREGSRRRGYNSTTYCRQIERQSGRQANEQCYIPYDTENPTEQAINCCRLKIKNACPSFKADNNRLKHKSHCDLIRLLHSKPEVKPLVTGAEDNCIVFIM